eukprot:COSAG01_NODE_6968_length_3412_cov_229.210383_4_plen_56_part_00
MTLMAHCFNARKNLCTTVSFTHRWTSNRGYIFGGPSHVRYERYKYPSLTSLGLSL